MWGLGVQITNAYVIYKTLKFQHGIKKDDLILHHDFIKRIKIHWITSGDDNISSASRSGAKRPLLSISKGGSTRRIIITTGLTSTSVSSLSMECEVINPKKGRASTSNNTSLQHKSHLSKIRLDSSLPHYPKIGKINARRALHRWLGHEA